MFLGLVPLVSGSANAAGSQPYPESMYVDAQPLPPYPHTEYFHFYHDHPTHTHSSQWQREAWSPQNWVALDPSRTKGKLLQRFIQADVIREIEIDEDEVPVVSVGPVFYNLSGRDKRRVAALIDHVYGFTAKTENGVYLLTDDLTCIPVGVYSRTGLQLQ